MTKIQHIAVECIVNKYGMDRRKETSLLSAKLCLRE